MKKRNLIIIVIGFLLSNNYPESSTGTTWKQPPVGPPLPPRAKKSQTMPKTRPLPALPTRESIMQMKASIVQKETKVEDGNLKFPAWSSKKDCNATCKSECAKKNRSLKFCSAKKSIRFKPDYEFSCTCLSPQEDARQKEREHAKAGETIKLKADCLKACRGTGTSVTIRFNKTALANPNVCIPECFHDGQTNATKALIASTKKPLEGEALKIAKDLGLKK